MPGVRLTRRSEAAGGGSGAMGVVPSIAATPPPLPRLATGRCSSRSDLQGAFRHGFVFSVTHPGATNPEGTRRKQRWLPASPLPGVGHTELLPDFGVDYRSPVSEAFHALERRPWRSLGAPRGRW
ncbi:unnamed protein product [Rangifer tarandus platyrhynchus]|uniref:Uncharacterized protein n=1 Tax=Rangifer tarandus platyrhynchus TaxID=3082113 RepID=A0ABN8Z960_RANTA|nr:unnamed protein product [Rangifer tarandus platyrhynchus]CAI9688813.1 unnamed protein product [Rangifer tarandus platyrhynchus]